METGYLVAGLIILAVALLSLCIGIFKPAGLMRITKMKLKAFTPGREPSDRAAVIACFVTGAVLAIAAAVLFVLGAVNY